MAALPPALSAAGRDPGSKKPFSYCPGGIDFSELKSPKIARRIAKHQAGASTHEPSSTLPPPAKVSWSEVRGEDGHTCHCQAATPGLVPGTPPPARHTINNSTQRVSQTACQSTIQSVSQSGSQPISKSVNPADG